jgi:hypothetical protein
MCLIITQDGNILVKRCSKTNVYVKGCLPLDLQSMTSVSNEIIKSNGLLELNKAVKLFDMKKFQNNVYRELKSAYPDRRRLEEQCISSIGFVKDANDVLDVPVWVMIINIVALDMLKAKMPPSMYHGQVIELGKVVLSSKLPNPS